MLLFFWIVFFSILFYILESKGGGGGGERKILIYLLGMCQRNNLEQLWRHAFLFKYSSSFLNAFNTHQVLIRSKIVCTLQWSPVIRRIIIFVFIYFSLEGMAVERLKKIPNILVHVLIIGNPKPQTSMLHFLKKRTKT